MDHARQEGIPIPFGGWYPGTGNIGWGQALTQDRTKFDCDRAGLVDLARQPDGSLRRVLCHDLVREVLGLGEKSMPASDRAYQRTDAARPVEQPDVAAAVAA